MAEKASKNSEDSKVAICSATTASIPSTIPQMQIEDPAILGCSEVKLQGSSKDENTVVCSTNGDVNELSLTLQNCHDNLDSNGGTTNGHFTHHNYDVVQNGHLSPSDDSGIGDQCSQSSQSPNQCFSASQMPAGHVNPPAVSTTSAPVLGATGYTGSPHGHLPPPTAASHSHHQRAHSVSATPQCRPSSPQNFASVPVQHHGSRGDSPHRGSPQAPQHVVHVVVNPGETFSVRIGEQIQHIQGKLIDQCI